MAPFDALFYSFLFGLLHGILPDEHTWPITFSYAVGGASGRQGMKAGLDLSSAFTFQRMLLSEVSRLALAPFLLSERINSVIYMIVGIAMSAEGAVVLKRHRYPHLHVVAHLGQEAEMRSDLRNPSAGLPSPFTGLSSTGSSPVSALAGSPYS